jgi:hypothetical protein
LVAAFLLLPLYELSDYSEVWQHDGDLIVPGLFFLFSGMTLLVGRHLYKAVRLVIQLRRVQSYSVTPVTVSRQTVDTAAFSPPPQNVAVMFCDLRI